MDYLISMYIDNELSIDDKIIFVEHVHAEQGFTDDAVAFLEQEKALRSALPEQAPEVALPFMQSPKLSFLAPKPLGLAFAASLLILVALFYTLAPPPQNGFHPLPAGHQHRFVIYQSGIKQIEIAGSFTNWQRIPLEPAGSAGYWEITLDIPPGEHVFSYILDGDTILADPTISAQEMDDFGTINSILVVEAS
ncbi:MAG: glycogen-binding domain-containing protein [Desulfobulbales bacterium]